MSIGCSVEVRYADTSMDPNMYVLASPLFREGHQTIGKAYLIHWISVLDLVEFVSSAAMSAAAFRGAEAPRKLGSGKSSLEMLEF